MSRLPTPNPEARTLTPIKAEDSLTLDPRAVYLTPWG